MNDVTSEAIRAGGWLPVDGHRFDAAYSSRLQGAVTTLDLPPNQVEEPDLLRCEDWRLNERHYGALQGVNRDAAAMHAGEHRVWRWRRGYEDPATPLSRTDATHPAEVPRYANVDPRMLPGVESLA